jgi:hypothetical protein
MTTGAVVEARQAEAAHTLHRARLMLGRARLELRPGVDEDQAAAMLARVLHHCHPFHSQHGRLLVAALRARSRAEQRAGPRPPAERIVRALLATGQAPTPKAVAAELERAEHVARAWQARLARVAPLVERDGPCVAEIVAGHWRRQGVSPTISEVARALGWRWADAEAIIAGMAEAGWVTVGRPAYRSLRPGPRARQATAAR